ncbi:MAG: trigger factor [bacterium]|nr:trigger factor [bacterium]
METTVTPKSKTEVCIEIELSQEEFLVYREKALKELAGTLKVEGFRQGHVPLDIALREIGEEALLGEAADQAVNKTYAQVVQEKEIEVVGEPEVSVLSLKKDKPFRFQITVSHIPSFDLPDYKKIAALCARKEVKVEDKETDQTLDWLRKSRAGENEELPELTDEFAQSLGKFDSISALKESIQEGLKREKEMRETDRLRQEILDCIGKEIKVELPAVLVEREKQAMLDRIKHGVQGQLNISFKDYLKKVEKTEEELLEGMKEDAKKRAINYLVLREISKKENIQPTQEEMEQEEHAIVAQHGREKAQHALDMDRVRAYTESAIRTEKTFQFLEEQSITLNDKTL